MNELEEKVLEANKLGTKDAFLAIPGKIKSGAGKVAQLIKDKIEGKSVAKKVAGDTLSGFYDRHAYNPYMERAMAEFGKGPKVIFGESVEGIGENQVLFTHKADVFGPMGLVTRTRNDVYPIFPTGDPNSGEYVLGRNYEYDCNYEGIMKIDGKYVYINFVNSGDRQSGVGQFYALTKDIKTGEYNATKEQYSNSRERDACELIGIYNQVIDYFQSYQDEVLFKPNCSIVQVADGTVVDNYGGVELGAKTIAEGASAEEGMEQ